MSVMSSPTPSSSDTAASMSSASSSAASTASDSEPETPASIASTITVVTKCTLCQETFTIPKVLSCLHTFCQPCLEKTTPESADKVTCPTCSADTLLPANGLPGLLADYAVSNILEATALDSTALLHCTGCKSKDTSAVARCFDCANFLCSNCVMAHQFMHCFEGHRVVTLKELQSKEENGENGAGRTEKPLPCPRHKQEVLRFYCRPCAMPICKECTATEHARAPHDFEFISDAHTREAHYMLQLAEQAKVKASDLRGSSKNIEHSTNRLQIHFEKARTEINETYNFYRSMLEDRKVEAMKELESAYNSKQVALSTTAQKMQECIESLYQSSDFIDKIVKHASMTEGLLFKKMVDSKLGSIMAYNPDVNMSNATDIEFISNYQAIQVGVRNTFGYVRQTPDSLQNKIQPIARPNGLTSRSSAIIAPPPPQPVSVSLAPPSTALTNGFSHFTNGNYEHFGSTVSSNTSLSNVSSTCSSLINAKQNFPSNSSISTMQSESLVTSNQYKEWSSGGPIDFFTNGTTTNSDIFASDPMIDLTNKLITANIYPPKSQIKRQKMIYHCKFGEFGVMEGQFTEPSGVAVNAQNDIIVADTNNHRIQIFDKEGRFKFQFGECGKRDGQLLYPNRVAVVKTSGDIVVTERSPTHQVQVYNQYGQFVRKFGANILQHPRGVTVDNKGRIIIVECKVMRVIIFDQMGNTLHKFSCSKHLEFPNGVVVNDREEIFISDNRAHCVKVFNYQGVFLRQIGGEGITNYPIGVGINQAGEVLIADNHNNFNLTVFTQDGQLINALESKVKHAQCFDVSLMIDDASIVLASKDYRLYVYRYAQLPPHQMTQSQPPMM